MKVIAVNGSPRKNWNTAKLLQKALQGAESKGARTELIHLYDLNFKGCSSCFACKRKNSKWNGLCAMKDDLTEVLKKVLECNILLLGSPIYFGNITGEMRSFLERFLFPNLSYNAGQRSLFQGNITSGFIYTMNVTEDQAKLLHYESVFQQCASLLRLFNGASEILLSYDTYQFKDYSLYEASKFDETHKAKMKTEQFPKDSQKAFELGVKLASISAASKSI